MSASKPKDRFEEPVLEIVERRGADRCQRGAAGKQPKRAPVRDIAEALHKSIEAVRKPVKRVTAQQSTQQKDKRKTTLRL